MSERRVDVSMRRVLVVDDDASLREMLALGLESEGYAVEQADDRETAIIEIEKFEPEVVVLDLGMPPHEHALEEGLAVLRWLEEHPRPLKVVVLTGQDQQASAYEAVRLGTFDYLAKPVSMECLLQSIRRCFLFLDNERRMRAQAQTQRVMLSVPVGQGVKPVRNLAEEKLLRQVLEETGFNVHETARLLNMNRENVYYLLKKYGIRRPES